MYNLFVLLILSASFTLVSFPYKYSTFTSFRLAVQMDFIMSCLTKMDGGFEPPL
nr:MAG TPA: hypothetical protein [Caudoviricetes sp.]